MPALMLRLDSNRARKAGDKLQRQRSKSRSASLSNKSASRIRLLEEPRLLMCTSLQFTETTIHYLRPMG